MTAWHCPPLPANAVPAAIKPAEFEACLFSWVVVLHEITDGQVVAIDGKTLQRMGHCQSDQPGPSRRRCKEQRDDRHSETSVNVGDFRLLEAQAFLGRFVR
jgi:hypothetical protein